MLLCFPPLELYITPFIALLPLIFLIDRSPTTARAAYLTIAGRMTPEDLDRLCGDCEWFGLGYCREGIMMLRNNGKPAWRLKT